MKKPDLDKLLRAVFDGLSDAGVWVDDAQVVGAHTTKRLAETGETPGAAITISCWPAGPES